MGSANERWRYNVTSSLIGWAHKQNDPCTREIVWKQHLFHYARLPKAKLEISEIPLISYFFIWYFLESNLCL